MSGMIGLRPVGRWMLLMTTLLTAALLGALGAGLLVQRASSQRAQAPAMQACVSIYTGVMRFVPAGANCSSIEYMITWNQQGPPGEMGPKGDPGPMGPAGPPTFLDTYMVSEHYDISDDGDDSDGGGDDGRGMEQVVETQFLASCEPGDLLLSGGYELIPGGEMETPPVVLAERPEIQTPGGGGNDGRDGPIEPTESTEGWLVSIRYDGGLTGLNVWAVCSVAGDESEPE